MKTVSGSMAKLVLSAFLGVALTGWAQAQVDAPDADVDADVGAEVEAEAEAETEAETQPRLDRPRDPRDLDRATEQRRDEIRRRLDPGVERQIDRPERRIDREERRYRDRDPRGPEPGFRLLEQEGRLMVDSVERGTPADEAGLRRGDEILSAEGQRFRSSREFEQFLFEQDRPTRITVLRNGREQTLRFGPIMEDRFLERDRFERREARRLPDEPRRYDDLQRRRADFLPRDQYGREQRIDFQERGALGVTLRSTADGVVITRVYPDSPADRIGLRPGDYIFSVNGEHFRTAEQMAAAIGQFESGERLQLEIGPSHQPGRLERATAQLEDWSMVFRQPTRMQPQITRIEPGYGPTYLDEGRQLDPRTVMRPDTGAMQQIRELEDDIRALEEEIDFLHRELRNLRSQIRELHPEEQERRPQRPAPQDRPELELEDPDRPEAADQPEPEED